jgi:hypothetical protein
MKKIIIIFLFLFTYTSWDFAQESDSVMLKEKQLSILVQQQDSLTININSNMAKSDSLAQQISILRAKQNLNFVERNRLDRLLKQSLDLSKDQENAVAKYRTQLKESNNLKAILTGLYSDQEKKLIELLKERPHNSLYSDSLSIVRLKNKSLGQNNHPLSSSFTDINLQIDESDIPGDIEAKATLFRDREDTFRQKAQELEKRYKKVKEETTLRNRLVEMVDDVRLFDSRDEAVSQNASNISAESQNKASDDNRGAWFNAEDMGGISNSVNVFNANELLGLDFQNMPTYDVQDYLIGLEKQKAVLLKEADSLSTLADSFEKEADRLRSTLKNAPK